MDGPQVDQLASALPGRLVKPGSRQRDVNPAGQPIDQRLGNARGARGRASEGAGERPDSIGGAASADGGEDRLFERFGGHGGSKGCWHRLGGHEARTNSINGLGEWPRGRFLTQGFQPLGQLAAAQEGSRFRRPAFAGNAGGREPDSESHCRGRVERGRAAMRQPGHGFGIGAQPLGTEAPNRVQEADRHASRGDIAGRRAILVERRDEGETFRGGIEGIPGRGLEPMAGGASGEMHHAHPGRFFVDLAAIGGHRFDDAEGNLRFVRELPGRALFVVRGRHGVVGVERSELPRDLVAGEASRWSAKGIADGHAEERPEKCVIGCVVHRAISAHPWGRGMSGLTVGPKRHRLHCRLIQLLAPNRSTFLVSTDHSERGPAAERLGFSSRAVHTGERGPRPDFTPTVTPIYPATAFVYDDTDTLDAVFGNERPGYVYSRYANPTTTALEAAVATLEGTEDAVAFASGMGAVYAAMLLDARAGDRIVAAPDVYGASYAILSRMMPTLGIETIFVDFRDLDAVQATLKAARPALVYAETISNPLMRVADLPAIVGLAHQAGARMAVDNTFASPWLVNPSTFGADSVVHSTTKYLGGHGDVTGGIIATTAERAAELREINKLIGAVSSPFDSWLTLRGIKTLPLRMRQQSDNARRVAAWLAADARVAQVNYPGQMDLGEAEAMFVRPERGGMISFEIAGAGRDEVFRFLEALRMVVPATTLGDVYSLVLYPAISSHRAVPPEERARIGIGDALIRLSVGIEDVDDIIRDLDTGLTAATSDPSNEVKPE